MELYTAQVWDEPNTLAVCGQANEKAPSDSDPLYGRVTVEPINGNVVITVERLDKDKFGPVSLVVV